MQTISSILSSTASAAQHLAKALTRARTDFTTQGNRTYRHVAGDLRHARDDVGEAAIQLGEILSDAVAAIRQASVAHRDDALRFYEQHSGRKQQNRSLIRRHPYMSLGVAAGLSYLTWITWRAVKAQHPNSAQAAERGEANGEEAELTKAPARRARPTKRDRQPKVTNGTSPTGP